MKSRVKKNLYTGSFNLSPKTPEILLPKKTKRDEYSYSNKGIMEFLGFNK
jgi:hypothetical protein